MAVLRALSTRVWDLHSSRKDAEETATVVSEAPTDCSEASVHFLVQSSQTLMQVSEEEHKFINQMRWRHWRHYDCFGEVAKTNEVRMYRIKQLEANREYVPLSQS